MPGSGVRGSVVCCWADCRGAVLRQPVCERKFGCWFLVKITSLSVVTTVQLVRAERFPIISRPSAAKLVRSSLVSFLKSFAVTYTLLPIGRLGRANASASSVSGAMICMPLIAAAACRLTAILARNVAHGRRPERMPLNLSVGRASKLIDRSAVPLYPVW